MLKDWILTPYNQIKVQPCGSCKQNKKPPVCNTLICLDTETSHNHDDSNPIGWIYQWAFSFQGQLVYGRTPTQLLDALTHIHSVLEIGDKKKLVIYVHNLSYDLQYLKDFLIEKWGTNYKMLAIASHKFLSFEINNIIFKCSYRLTNKSLDKFIKDTGAQHKKLIGTIDYDVIRHQYTPLTRKDWRYMFYDVVGMHEALTLLLQQEHDNLVSVPLTSTGFVRRDGRNASRKAEHWRDKFTNSRLEIDQYNALRLAFSGGITHGNRFYADKTINGRIRHYDFRSHYPTQLRCRKFPMGKFNLLGEHLRIEDIKPYLNDYCCLALLCIDGATLRDKAITLPYLQVSKVKQAMEVGGKLIEDNGRVLSFSGKCKLWVTEQDLIILWRQYKFNTYYLDKVYVSLKDYLPVWFCDFVDKYYFEKTDYKKQVKKATTEVERIEAELSLLKSKNRLNGIYGMTATAIIRESYKMTDSGEWYHEFDSTPEKLLNKFYNSRNNFLPYQWGVWVTAYARAELVEMVELIGYNNFLYCDTDSAFFKDDTGDIEKAVKEWNASKYEDAIKHGAYIKSGDDIVVYHQFEDEKEDINKFRFLHAKCYAYEVSGKLHCTIAGVRDRKGKDTREKELGNINNLSNGFVFTRMGGTKALYTEQPPSILDGDEVASACIITPTTKTLKNELEYADFDEYIETE